MHKRFFIVENGSSDYYNFDTPKKKKKKKVVLLRTVHWNPKWFFYGIAVITPYFKECIIMLASCSQASCIHIILSKCLVDTTWTQLHTRWYSDSMSIVWLDSIDTWTLKPPEVHEKLPRLWNLLFVLLTNKHLRVHIYFRVANSLMYLNLPCLNPLIPHGRGA